MADARRVFIQCNDFMRCESVWMKWKTKRHLCQMDLRAKQGHCKFAQDFEDFFVVLQENWISERHRSYLDTNGTKTTRTLYMARIWTSFQPKAGFKID